jgi:hypothetical protein
VAHALVLRWWRTRNDICGALRSARNRMRISAARVGKYDDAEVQTAIDIRAQRTAGLKVSARVIRAKMRVNVTAKYDAATASTFKASDCWLAAFVSRFGFAWRRATNRKSKTIDDRLPAVRLYLSRLARRLRRHVRPAVEGDVQSPSASVQVPADPHPMGIPSALRLNVDQSPLNLDIDGRYTYDEKGAKAVHVVARHGQHKDSRDATLQILINLSGVRQLQPAVVLVFRGQGRVSQAELDAYDKRVLVYYQKKV